MTMLNNASFVMMCRFSLTHDSERGGFIQESPPQFENRIMAQMYVRSITRTM